MGGKDEREGWKKDGREGWKKDEREGWEGRMRGKDGGKDERE